MYTCQVETIIKVRIPQLGMRGFYAKSNLSKRLVKTENVLIEKLLLAREMTPANLVLRPTATDTLANPVQRCSARPFFFWQFLKEHGSTCLKMA